MAEWEAKITLYRDGAEVKFNDVFAIESAYNDLLLWAKDQESEVGDDAVHLRTRAEFVWELLDFIESRVDLDDSMGAVVDGLRRNLWLESKGVG